MRAFSIDDATTTEIDDAFSVRELANGNYEIGIHIAAPALAIPRGTPLDAIARERLSTVYMPGRKITMLPDDGRSPRSRSPRAHARPRCRCTPKSRPTARWCGTRRASNRVPIAANLRLDAIGDAFANDLPSPADPPWTAELRALWKLAQALSAQRGKADFTRIDYSFDVDWDAARGRPRGASCRARAAARSTSSSPS